MENALPVRLWGQDPLYWSHVKLFARDVLQLKNYPGFKGVYAISNHPIVQVLVTGYVVKVDKREKLTTYGVDDGTGCISCCMWLDQNKDSDTVEANLGDLVTVTGKISVFREERQITISTLQIEKDANAEVLHWLEVMKLREIYEKPFEPPELANPKAKSAKPWLKGELAIEIDRLEELLKSEIAEYLESSGMLCFTLETICRVSKLAELVKDILDKYAERSGKNKGERNQASLRGTVAQQILKGALRNLQEKEGIVYCKPGINPRQYEFISVNDDLAPRVVRVTRAICNSQGESSDGVAKTKIMTSLKSTEKYKHVRPGRVLSALEYLMTIGDIYETRREHYRIV